MEAPDSPYPYFLGGAGFIAIYENMGAFITAAHVVRNLNPTDFLILPHDSNIGLPLTSMMVPKSGIDADDVAVFPFDLSKAEADAPRLREHSLPLGDMVVGRGGSALAAGASLEAAACPGETCAIDYDVRQISAKTLTLNLEYLAPDAQRKYLHRAALKPRADLASWAGISGSPVYAFNPPSFGFVGMIVEAGGEICHFIDSSRIYAIIRRIHSDIISGAV